MREISTWMIMDVVTVSPEQKVVEATNIMKQHSISAVVIVDPGRKPIGIFTERDIVTKVISSNLNPNITPVRDVMTGNIITISPSAEFKDVFSLMISNQIRHLPVVDNDRLVGIVSIRDLLRFHMKIMEQTVFQLSQELQFVREIITKSNDERSRTLYEENEKLKGLVIIDSLTGLYNYKYLKDVLPKEIDRAKRYQGNVTVLFLDIDDFKFYNDTHGHEMGNQVLQQLAQLLKNTSRHSDALCKNEGIDVIARYGGEEFVIVMPETSKKWAMSRAQRLMEDVRKFPFSKGEMQPKGKITISIGLSEYPTDAPTAEELLRRADEALYKAKHQGKDQII